MGNNEARVVGTIGIWLAVTIVGVAALVNATSLGGLLTFLIVAVLAAVAAGATQSIWGSSQNAPSQDAEKSKRRTRIDRVLERMNDDELDELRARLMSESDGEAVSINELLAERDRRKS